MDYSSGEFANDTALVGDPLAEVEEEMEQEFRRYHVVWTIQMVFVFVKIILCLVSVAADLFLVVTILRFRRLRTRLNNYILHMCIVTVLLYLVVPILITVIEMIFHNLAIFYMMEVQNTFLMSYVTFSLLLAVDWTISSYKSSWINLYSKYYKYCLPSIYVLFSIYTVTMICVGSAILSLMRTFIIFYIICALILVGLNLLRRFTKSGPESQKTVYAMAVSNIAIFSFLPTFVVYWVLMTIPHNFTVDLIFVFIESAIVMFTIAHPIFIVYYLGRTNKYFKMAYNKSFKRSVRNYGDDNLDEVSEDETHDSNKVVNFSNGNGVDENKQILIA